MPWLAWLRVITMQLHICTYLMGLLEPFRPPVMLRDLLQKGAAPIASGFAFLSNTTTYCRGNQGYAHSADLAGRSWLFGSTAHGL